MQKTKKQISIATALMCSVLSFNSQAQTCVDAPDCKSLGYQFTQKECEGMSSVKCPYDDSYYFCIQGSTDAYDSNIGDILYDDFTTSPNIITTKKPIGVVFTTGRDVNYAIALDNASTTGLIEVYIITGGFSNLKAPDYTTKGTIMGDWEVPTIDLLQIAYYNKDKVNQILNRIGGRVLTGSYMATNNGNVSMSDGSTSTSGTVLRPVIKLNPPAGKSYTYTLENCDGAVDGGIYHGKFEKCRKEPKRGEILTGDKKFVNYEYFDRETIKNMAIGLIEDEEERIALSFYFVKKDGSIGKEEMPWSSKTCDIPNLPVCTLDNYESCGTDGRANTDAILATNGGCSGETYAANAANAYEPENCKADFCKKGKWFLPTLKNVVFSSSIENGRYGNYKNIDKDDIETSYVDIESWTSTAASAEAVWDESRGAGGWDFSTDSFINPPTLKTLSNYVYYVNGSSMLEGRRRIRYLGVRPAIKF